MRADATHYYLQAELVAYENERRIFTKHWSEKVVRHGQ